MSSPTEEYINCICSLYDSSYDDRIENTAPPTAGDQMRTPGEDWMPGATANHKSLQAFQRELENQGIKLSTSKIKKILITGGLWTTETSRTIQEMFSTYTSSVNDGGEGLNESTAVKRIAEELSISTVSVSVNLPYMDVVYNLPEPSANAKRCRRWKERHNSQPVQGSSDIAVEDGKIEPAATTPTGSGISENRDGSVDDEPMSTEAEGETPDWYDRVAEVEDVSFYLWKMIVGMEGETFTTSGRGSRPGISFRYRVSRSGGAGGRHYNGISVDGYGNELFIIKTGDGGDGGDGGEGGNGGNGEQLKKSISRSTVDLAYKVAVDMKGCVRGPKALGIPGAGSYVYGIFKRLGVIRDAGVE